MRERFAIQLVRGPELLCPEANNFSRRPWLAVLTVGLIVGCVDSWFNSWLC